MSAKSLNAVNAAHLIPFNPSDFVSKQVAETCPLASVLSALASNDPERIVRAVDDYNASLYQVSAALSVVAEAIRLTEQVGNGAGSSAGEFASRSDYADALGMLSGLTKLHADMNALIVEATSRTAQASTR